VTPNTGVISEPEKVVGIAKAGDARAQAARDLVGQPALPRRAQHERAPQRQAVDLGGDMVERGRAEDHARGQADMNESSHACSSPCLPPACHPRG
jgi:hypothetical protein